MVHPGAVLTSATVLAVVGWTVAAQALDVRDVENDPVTFSGEGCGAVDAATVRLPNRSHHIRVIRPKVGQHLESTADTTVVATVTSVKTLRKGRTRRWPDPLRSVRPV